MIILGLSLALGCNTNEEKKITKSMNDVASEKEELDCKKSIVEKGDTNCYQTLRVLYMERPLDGLLFWSLLMANKYDYPQAYYDVYYILLESNGKDIYDVTSLDDKTRKIAIEYLAIAAEKRQFAAIEIMDSLGKEKQNIRQH